MTICVWVVSLCLLLVATYSQITNLTGFFSGGKSHLRKTATKKALEQSTIDHFRESKIWKMENDFYEFAYKIFQDIKRRTLVEKDGKLVALKQQYFYEKIRPRN